MILSAHIGLYEEIHRVGDGDLSPHAALLIGHLFFRHQGSDLEVIIMTQFLEASDKYMEGLDNTDFNDSPPLGQIAELI